VRKESTSFHCALTCVKLKEMSRISRILEHYFDYIVLNEKLRYGLRIVEVRINYCYGFSN
jgi:hypothetical protein